MSSSTKDLERIELMAISVTRSITAATAATLGLQAALKEAQVNGVSDDEAAEALRRAKSTLPKVEQEAFDKFVATVNQALGEQDEG